MEQSLNLISAQISFLEPHLALVHIPLELYTFCVQPILRLLFGEDHDADAAQIPWTNRHDFLNVSVTPVECSIICSRALAERFIRPAAHALNRLYDAASDDDDNTAGQPRARQIHISDEDYIGIQVDGQGLDAGQRVLELTSPLAMAGISIFFITTYFSDYILVPFRSRRTVTKALQQRGFVFSQSADAFISQLSPSSPSVQQSGRFTSPFHEAPMPSTPPAKDIPELQIRTFTKLHRNNVKPIVNRGTLLMSCAGSRESDPHRDERLKNDLLQVLLSTSSMPRSPPAPGALDTASDLNIDSLRLQDEGAESPPDFAAQFLSLTITSNEPISVLLEHRLLPRLGSSLLGAKSEEDALVPITLDLRDLPLEATGIVCGVAGRLAQGGSEEGEIGWSPQSTAANGDADMTIDISFLSTARAGTVIVKASQLERAVDALAYGMKKVAETV